MIKEGDWVIRNDAMVLGVVRDVFESSPGQHRFNLYVYNRAGELTGRYTEPEPGDGARGYEPNLRPMDFLVIDKPRFPLPALRYLRT